jgi:Zn-dependent protease
MIVFGGLKFQPVYFLSFFTVILIHEIGHALVVKAYSFRNHELIVHGLGGACIWSGSATQKQMSIISWGGVLAQLFVFIIFLLIPKLITLPPYDFLDQIFRAFIGTNLFIIIINMIPFDPLDGVEAWKLFDPVWEDLKSLKNKQKYRSSDKIVKNQIIKIFKENDKTPNKRV